MRRKVLIFFFFFFFFCFVGWVIDADTKRFGMRDQAGKGIKIAEVKSGGELCGLNTRIEVRALIDDLKMIMVITMIRLYDPACRKKPLFCSQSVLGTPFPISNHAEFL